MAYTQKILVATIALLFAVAVSAQNVQERVVELEGKGDHPKPFLEALLTEGSRLEEAARLTVASADTAAYAQAFTYHAICMAVSEMQAERIHDIAISAAEKKYKNSVLTEARYSLFQFKENRCNSVEQSSRAAPVQKEIMTETIAGGASNSM